MTVTKKLIKRTIRIHQLPAGWQEVAGEIVDFVDFEDFAFVLHRRVDQRGWAVSEASTGLAVYLGLRRQDVLDGTANRLQQVEPIPFAKIVASAREAQAWEVPLFEQLPGILKPRDSS